MEIKIREAQERDFPAVIELIKALALFENSPEKVTNSVSLMNEERDFFRCIVAETGEGEIAGFALYYFAYYTWVGKSLYLDDIYVKETYRRMGIATALMKQVLETAVNERCKRVRWQVLEWNKGAIAMYKNLKASIDNEWLNCTIEPLFSSDL